MYNHFSTISHWEQQSYGAGLYRSADALAACFHRNPLGLMTVCEGGVLLGYADVWPLQLDFYAALRLGLVFEESLAASVILPPSAPAAHFYIGSMISDPVLRRDNPDKARRVFAQLRAQLARYFAGLVHYPVMVLGVGSSDKGKSILARWGFEPVQAVAAAVDLRPRFERGLTNPKGAGLFL